MAEEGAVGQFKNFVSNLFTGSEFAGWTSKNCEFSLPNYYKQTGSG